MTRTILKLTGMALLLGGFGAAAFAAAVPEIDPATGINALALVSGALLIIRSRRR